MPRICLSTLGLVLASCTPAPTPATGEPAPPPRAVNSPSTAFPVDYTGWSTLTEKPVHTNMRAMLDCRAPRPFRLNADGTSPESVDSPHHIPALRYFASKEFAPAVIEGKSPYPVGTTIVKEKLSNPEAEKPFAVAAMIKREKGYDPDHGDWEYVYTTLGENPETQRGKISSCIACHRIKAEQDYLYRTYLE